MHPFTPGNVNFKKRKESIILSKLTVKRKKKKNCNFIINKVEVFLRTKKKKKKHTQIFL